jgi:hypothetical protein
MRQVKNKLTLLALTGCAIAATAACSTPSDAPIAAPSASSGAGSAAGQAAGPAPSPTESASTRPAAPAEKPARVKKPAPAEKPATGQGGQADDTDWAKAAFGALGCKRHADLPKRAEVQHVDHSDLTGDGRPDTIVAASCPTTTSTNAVRVFVFGADSGTEPLLTIGKDSYLRTADLRAKGRSLTVESEALSDDASLCCPDLRITQSWKWTGSAFTRTAFKSTAL